MPRGWGAKFVLIATDAFTGGIYLETMRTLTAKNASAALWKIVNRVGGGAVRVILTDKGELFQPVILLLRISVAFCRVGICQCHVCGHVCEFGYRA